MNPRQVALAIEIAIEQDARIFLWGDAGTAKTDICRQVAERMGYFPLFIYLANNEVADLIGKFVEYEDNGTTVSTWTRPEWFHQIILHQKKGLATCVIADEMNRARPEVKNAFYPFVLNKMLHFHQAPDSVRILAAGNPPTRTYDVDPIDQSLGTRWCHLWMETDAGIWLRDFAPGRVHEDVIGFIAGEPGQLNEASAEEFDHTAETTRRPRTWDSFSKIYTGLKRRDLLVKDPIFCEGLLAGCVGSLGASDFMRSLKERYYTVEDVLSGKVHWGDVEGDPTEAKRLAYRIMGSMTYQNFDKNQDGLTVGPATSAKRKDHLARFLVDMLSSEAETAFAVAMGLFKAEPKLAKWLSKEEGIRPLVQEIYHQVQKVKEIET